MSETKLNFGILSAAHYHATHWTNAALTNPSIHFVGIWDDKPERGREAAATLGVEFIPDLQEILGICDAVGITSETIKHVSLVRAASEAGVHVLMEKPMARSLAECEEILQAVDAGGIRFMQNFTKRYDPAHHDLVRCGPTETRRPCRFFIASRSTSRAPAPTSSSRMRSLTSI